MAIHIDGCVVNVASMDISKTYVHTYLNATYDEKMCETTKSHHIKVATERFGNKANVHLIEPSIRNFEGGLYIPHWCVKVLLESHLVKITNEFVMSYLVVIFFDQEAWDKSPIELVSKYAKTVEWVRLARFYREV